MIAEWLCVLALAALLAASPAADRGGEAMEERSIEDVLRAHTGRLLSLPGVVGTAEGVCSGRPCIKVYVIRKGAELDRNIPEEIEGYPVEVEETGEIKPLPRKE